MKRDIYFISILVLVIAALICSTVNSSNTAYYFESDSQFPVRGIPVLMYHSIKTSPDNPFCVSEEQFKEEIKWLYDNNYHTLSIDEFYGALINNGSVPENPVLITFDDGYADNYKVAWPILKQYGYTATFFVVINYINQYTIDWDQLKDLIRQGNSIGSHTVNHLELTALTDIEQEKELRESKQILEENLGVSIRAFCFPGGKYNKTTSGLLPDCGYSLSFTTNQGRVHFYDNQYLLDRVFIKGGMSSSKFIKQVAY